MAFNLVLIMHCKISSSCGSNLLKDGSKQSLIGENCNFWEKEEEDREINRGSSAQDADGSWNCLFKSKLWFEILQKYFLFYL